MQLTKSKIQLSFILSILVLIIASCSSNNNESGDSSNQNKLSEPVYFDLDKIKERGSLIAVVDNSTTGYFIYRGRPMGYEYELLTRLAKELEVELKVELVSNMERAFEMLNSGKADLMAYHLTITKERSQRVAFSVPHNNVRQVLVQRKPDNWRNLKLHQIDTSVIRNPIDLGGKTVYTRKGSSFADRLNNLSEEIGQEIDIVEVEGNVDTEGLIRQVARGEIEYTVADEDVAMINRTYNPILDIATDISFPQQIAWAMRKNSTVLKNTVDEWLTEMKRHPDFYVIYNKYFKSSKTQRLRASSDFSSINQGRISPYDELIIEGAKELEIDWLLLASIIFQESKFDPEVESWAGAKGLMQLTNIVIEEYDVDDVFDPEDNIRAGVQHLAWLMDYWAGEFESTEEQIKFTLAAYNVGQGHVRDAMRLAEKYDEDSHDWEVIAKYLLLKSQSEYYNDEVVQFGYCRGTEPVNYIKQIMNRYEQYQLFFSDKERSVNDSTIIIEAALVH